MANSIIIFSDYIDESSKIGGFKIVNSKNIQKYLKIISLLEEEGVEISNGELNLTYNSESFDHLKLTSGDVKCLEKLFDIEINGMESDSCGFFPDILNDAYNADLIDDNDLENCSLDEEEED